MRAELYQHLLAWSSTYWLRNVFISQTCNTSMIWCHDSRLYGSDFKEYKFLPRQEQHYRQDLNNRYTQPSFSTFRLHTVKKHLLGIFDDAIFPTYDDFDIRPFSSSLDHLWLTLTNPLSPALSQSTWHIQSSEWRMWIISLYFLLCSPFAIMLTHDMAFTYFPPTFKFLSSSFICIPYPWGISCFTLFLYLLFHLFPLFILVLTVFKSFLLPTGIRYFLITALSQATFNVQGLGCLIRFSRAQVHTSRASYTVWFDFSNWHIEEQPCPYWSCDLCIFCSAFHILSSFPGPCIYMPLDIISQAQFKGAVGPAP